MPEADTVRGTFETDPISALGLPSPVSIGANATIGEALAAVQAQGSGYVLITDQGRPVSILTDREVLMRIVARDVDYGSGVASLGSPTRTMLASRPIAEALRLMTELNIDNLPIVDDAGKATAVLRTLDVIRFLAEAFPEHVLNLPPNLDQTLPKPEGA